MRLATSSRAASRGAAALRLGSAASVQRATRVAAAASRQWQTRESPSAEQQRSFFASSKAELSESFLDGSSAQYVDAMHAAWQRDPASVHSAWDAYFRNVDAGLPAGSAYMSPPTIRASSGGGSAGGVDLSALAAALQMGGASSSASSSNDDGIKVKRLMQTFRTHGHALAATDPLKLKGEPDKGIFALKNFGFSEADLEREVPVANYHFGVATMKLKELIARLEDTYTSSIGMEFEHIDDEAQKEWIRARLETAQNPLTKEEKLALLDRLAWADGFEKFLHKKFGQDKRFGLDGGENLIPLMKALIDRSAKHGVENVVIGMPHRGRLNVLANVLRKPLEQILKEFEKPASEIDPEKYDFSFHSGDVKYHLGTSVDRPTANGKNVHLALMANPSHLEAVDPLVEGKVRAIQDGMGDKAGKHSMAVQLHGDAAFAGQGVVYECLQMSGLKHYTTGGTVHIIVNNQIGFTTPPHYSSRGKCTDVGKSAELPIFHVNGDDAEACLKVAIMASDWRDTFGTDAIIDIVCYRRHGHNELDEPKFTQPLMYDKIKSHPDSMTIYSQQLVEEGVLSKEALAKDVIGKVQDECDRAFERAKDFEAEKDSWLSSRWKGFHGPAQKARIRSTGVPMETLVEVGKAISHLPDHITVHPAIKRDFKRKTDAIFSSDTSEKLVDWGTAEALAFGTLLLEGNTVRLSGQDVERGTFSHRHSVITDQKSGETYVPLNNLGTTQAQFHICNSLLSEFGVLGFETGYSLESPNALVLWEAQFGDFANGAQVIIDQFIASGEAKWQRQCGVVLLLPHGYDGQGPEHSSARLERFLQLCDGEESEWDRTVVNNEDERRATETQIQTANLQVVNCTTPAQYFHVLRRQIHRTFRKPLVVMSPKNLLRHPLCKSSLEDFDDQLDVDTSHHADDTRFERVFTEADPAVMANASSVRRVILCSGKVYYDLVQEREARGITDVALVRLEQLAPFPWLRLHDTLVEFNPKAEIVWCQEEPKNAGAWFWCQPRVNNMLKESGRSVSYAGREPMAAPATGSGVQHKLQVASMMDAAFN